MDWYPLHNILIVRVNQKITYKNTTKLNETCNAGNIFIIFNNISVKGEKENKEKITIRITVPIIN